MSSADTIIVEQSVVVEIDAVKQYRRNPRVGNLEAIRESIRENGQFRPIIVQKSTGEILGGNHTWKAMKAEGKTHIAACYVDVDDDHAAKIVLADNRTNDLATYNTEVLGDILANLATPAVGTGYSPEDVSDLLTAVSEKNTEILADIVRPPVTINPLGDYGDMGPENDNSLGNYDDLDLSSLDDPLGVLDPEVEAAAPDQFKEAADELQGAYGLKFGHQYEKVGGMDIPPLRPDMLVTPDMVPRDLLAWAGSATKDHPIEDQWWLYNFGIDSTSGMKDVSKVIMSFYAFDQYFENWWDFPDRYTAKMLNSGIKMAVVPDFSQWAEDPLVLSLYNLYRNRYLGRYFQEAGIKVIPNISWRYGDQDYFDKYVRATLPKELPVVAMQLQTFDKDQTEEQVADLKKMIEYAGAELDPDLTIFYVGKQARKMIEEGLNWPGEHLVISNRMEALSAQAKGRKKKTTI